MDSLLVLRRRGAGQRIRLAEEAAPVGVLQVEDGVQRPVEVMCEAGRLREHLRGRRPCHFPRRPSSISVRSTSNGWAQWGQVTDPTASPSVLMRSYNRWR